MKYDIGIELCPKWGQCILHYYSPDGQSQSLSLWYGRSEVCIHSLHAKCHMIEQFIETFGSHPVGTVKLFWPVPRLSQQCSILSSCTARGQGLAHPDPTSWRWCFVL